MDPGEGRLTKKTHEEFKKEWTGVLMLLMPSDDFTKADLKVSVFKRFWFLLKPHKSILFQILIGALIYTILGLSTSIYIQKITDYVFVGGNRKMLNLFSIIMIIILLFQIFLSASKSILSIKTAQLIDARLILGYYKHLLKLPQRFFDTMRVGEIVSRINDAVKIRVFINDVLVSFIVNIFIVTVSFLLMFIYSWKLALVMLAIIPIYSIIYFVTNFLNKKTERKLMVGSADLESQLVESITSVGTIKRFGLENFANVKTETRFVGLLDHIYTSGKNSVFSSTTSEFTAKIFTIILFWVGSGFVINKSLTPGELMSFYALMGYLTGPIGTLIGMNKTIQNALIAADRLFEIMDLEREEVENKIELTEDLIGDIAIKNISFRYGSRVDVFENFSITFPKGKITAIVGESGSGKTTILSLLQNIYPIQKGSIEIGDINIKYFSNTSLRKLVSVVPQKIDLFSGNVIDNIAVGEFVPNMEKIISICKDIGIYEFIESLPQGFKTYLGENGATLSGGQKQRLAIARALYKNPEILILDEATSSLDTASEQQVQQAIASLRKHGKTIIIIAHRLSTVMNADKIVVLEKGKLLEEGTHNELYIRQGKYYNLWQQQMPSENLQLVMN